MTTIATWSIKSVRVRKGLVKQFLEGQQPDILCLQETKSPVDKLPDGFEKLGYEIVTACGFKGYNGVAILSRVPVEPVDNMEMCGLDRKSTRLNSSHVASSYAVFCLKKKKMQHSKTAHIHNEA